MTPSAFIIDHRIPLPLDRGFTYREALERIGRRQLRTLVSEGIVRQVVRGGYAVSDVPLTVSMRAALLAQLVAPGAVITDLTAAWLHGADMLDHRGGPPDLDLKRLHEEPRIRRDGVRGGTRMLSRADVQEVDGVWVTSPLRTGLDLGRSLRGGRALAALDAMARAGDLTSVDFERELGRFKGFRGVIQLRALVPHVDGRSESVAESDSRFGWIEAGLPKPDLQIRMSNPFGIWPWRWDLGLARLRWGVDYDGAEFHASDEQRAQDRLKREYAEEQRWHVTVLTKIHVYTNRSGLSAHLRSEFRTACLKLGVPESRFRWPTPAAT